MAVCGPIAFNQRIKKARIAGKTIRAQGEGRGLWRRSGFYGHSLARSPLCIVLAQPLIQYNIPTTAAYARTEIQLTHEVVDVCPVMTVYHTFTTNSPELLFQQVTRP